MKISTRMTLGGVILVALSMMAFLATVLVQRGLLRKTTQSLVSEQAKSEAGKVVQTIYLNCESFERRNQVRLTHDLNLAHEFLAKGGKVSTAAETVEWNSINQFTKDSKPLKLPKLLLGGTWLGQNVTTNEVSPVVDDVMHFTRDFCTIFQRINDEGDMLRVCTSVLNTNGTRAIGTFIPHRNPDGSANPVVVAVLQGRTYRGRAFVVNDYHAAAYEPIWNGDQTKVIGMLYVGVAMGSLNKELHDTISQLEIGKSGYVAVLGGKADNRGKFLVPPATSTAAIPSSEAIDSVVAKTLAAAPGSLTNSVYESGGAQRNFMVSTYFQPWDWVIAASGNESDFEPVVARVAEAINWVLKWSLIGGVFVGLVGLGISFYMSRGMSLPIMRMAHELDSGAKQTLAAADQVSLASRSLTDGAARQMTALRQSNSSLSGLARITLSNASSAQKANDLTKQARVAADRGAADVQHMNSAMAAIKVSSDDIAKIIKTIDEIAFQTNILALNAAVESARAGEAGMGFAVVADEVRNLARRSAEAAKETAMKIEGAILRTAQGVEISGKVASALEEIVVKAHQVDQLVAEVANFSQEQTQGLKLITTAVQQLDEINQLNSASAQQSAAAAQQLNAQAASMKSSLGGLLELVDGPRSSAQRLPARSRAEKGEVVSVEAAPAPVVPADSGSLITWDPARMSTGVKSIDEQHQELISMINALHQACRDGTGKAELRRMMSFLGQYVQTHFKHEEGLMAEHRCPSKQRNEQAHKLFLNNFQKLVATFEAKGETTVVLLDLRQLVGDWLANHICSVDTGLRQCATLCPNKAKRGLVTA